MRIKFNLKKLFENISFVLLMLLIFPNDYKNFNTGFQLLFIVIPMIITIWIIITKFNSIIYLLIKYYYFFIPHIVLLLSSIFNENFEIQSLYNIYIIFVILILSRFYFYKDDRYFILADNISLIVLLCYCISVYFIKEPFHYTASGGRVFFIFEGSAGILLISNIFLFFLSKKHSFMSRWIHYIIWILTLINVSLSLTTYAICTILFLIYLVFYKYIKNFKSVLNLTWILIVMVMLFDFFVISGYFVPLVANFLNKSLTLSGRTIIWEQLIQLIKLKPILGYGAFNADLMIDITHVSGATHAHNQVLQILFVSGGIGLLSYFKIFKKVLKTRIKLNDLYAYYIGYFIIVMIASITLNSFSYFFLLITFIVLLQNNEN